MEPLTIPFTDLLEKGVLIKMPIKISLEEYNKIYSKFIEFERVTIYDILLDDMGLFFSPESLIRLHERMMELANSTIQKKIERIRVMLENLYFRQDDKEDFALKLLQTHLSAYRNNPNRFWFSTEDNDKQEAPTDLPLFSDEETSSQTLLDFFVNPEPYFKKSFTRSGELMYFIVKNEQGKLDDDDIFSWYIFEKLLCTLMDKQVASFVKEEVLDNDEGSNHVDEFIKETLKPGPDCPKKIILLEDLGIIDFIMDTYEEISPNKVGSMLAPLLGENPNNIGRIIRSIYSPMGSVDKNYPYNNPVNQDWVDHFLRSLKLPQKKI